MFVSEKSENKINVYFFYNLCNLVLIRSFISNNRTSNGVGFEKDECDNECSFILYHYLINRKLHTALHNHVIHSFS
jgi:hypothetical protein